MLLILPLLVALPSLGGAQEKGPPPANVVVAAAVAGTMAPVEEFVGTVFYPEVSDVSSEVSGKVDEILFEEGDPLLKGAILVRLDGDLLEKNLQSQTALYGQTLADLDGARKDFERTKSLYEKRTVSEKEYDDQRFQVQGLEKKADSVRADMERMNLELEKTAIRAPFSGVAVKKNVARGEWVAPGTTVATVARNNYIDAIVNVPERITPFLRPGMSVPVVSGGKEWKGAFQAVVPQGDIPSRTFPVRIRVLGAQGLYEGMEARVRLPSGLPVDTIVVPRDGVLNILGATSIVAVVDGKARTIPVKVTGYEGRKMGIQSDQVSEGMTVVVQGNERLRTGQPVNIIGRTD